MTDPLFYPWFKSSQECDVIALAASAGGVEAFAQLLSALPSDFRVPIIALLHRGKREHGRDVLVNFLSRRSQLRVIQAKHGDRLEAATIHVMPPMHDMRLYAGRFQLHTSTSRTQHPSADILFESMAEEYGPRCIGVVLSGALKDGARGVALIKGRYGTVLVQAPETAIVSQMPRAAIRTGFADGIMHPSDIADTLVSLTLGRRRGRHAPYTVDKRHSVPAPSKAVRRGISLSHEPVSVHGKECHAGKPAFGESPCAGKKTAGSVSKKRGVAGRNRTDLPGPAD